MEKKTYIGLGGPVRFHGKYLLMKRSSEKKFAANKWEFPNGNPHERERIEDAIKREIKEETGLEVRLGDRYILQVEDEHGEWVVIYYLCEADSDKVRLSDEHTEFVWVNLNEARDMDLASGTKRMFEILRENNGH